MANRNWMNGHKLYTNITAPSLVDCNFIVDSTNGNGLGIRSLKSNGYVKSVYMHTSSTPATGNPNPAAGYIIVQLTDNYAKSLSGWDSKVSPVSGTPILVASAGVTSVLAYTIVTVGTTTTAGWQSLGFPAGFTPAVGASFIASSTTTATGTGAVEVPATAGTNITNIETIGNPNTMIANSNMATNGGAYFVLQTMKNAAKTAPADGTVISLNFLLDNSSVTVDGL